MKVNVKILRSKAFDKKMTQRAISKNSGLSIYAVSKVFNGKSVREDTASKICDLLGLELKDVVVFENR